MNARRGLSLTALALAAVTPLAGQQAHGHESAIVDQVGSMHTQCAAMPGNGMHSIAMASASQVTSSDGVSAGVRPGNGLIRAAGSSRLAWRSERSVASGDGFVEPGTHRVRLTAGPRLTNQLAREHPSPPAAASDAAWKLPRRGTGPVRITIR